MGKRGKFGKKPEPKNPEVAGFQQSILERVTAGASPIIANGNAIGNDSANHRTPSSDDRTLGARDPPSSLLSLSSSGGTHNMDRVYNMVHEALPRRPAAAAAAVAATMSNNNKKKDDNRHPILCESDDDLSDAAPVFHNPKAFPADHAPRRTRRGLAATTRGRLYGSSNNSTNRNQGNNGGPLRTPRANVAFQSQTSNNNNNDNRGQPQSRTPHVNEHILDDLIAQAEFELQHDPYRGMLLAAQPQRNNQQNGERSSSSSNNTQRIPKNPWKECEWRAKPLKDNFQRNRELMLNLENRTKRDMDGSELAAAWVEETCRCHCPTLQAWTQASVVKDRQALNKKKRNKKRKVGADTDSIEPPKVGQRPEDPLVRCPCDYNPFCIGTLGGVVNTMWQDTTNDLLRTRKEQHENMENMRRVQVDNTNMGGGTQHNNSDSHPFFAAKEESAAPEPMVIDVDSSSKPAPTTTKQGDNNNNIDDDDDDDDEVIEVSGSTSSTRGNDNKANGCIILGTSADIDYAPDTAHQLKRVRSCIMVKAQPILDHLESLLSKAPAKLSKKTTSNQLLRIFTRWQSSLIFSNPLRDDLKATLDLVPMALPPGISNLGATCYLNTQLQCLAQNKAFLKGIVSWRSADTTNAAAGGDSASACHNNVMNSVLTELQSLLVKMVEGSEGTVTTLAFSTALRLEHDEQQDPNEFARLLFERMHESFQQHPSLKTLLPSLFEGSTTYETQCLECNTISTRSESFMDLNLPIVQPPKEEDTKEKGIGGKISHFFTKAMGKESESTSLPNAHADTDLQYCLDEYSTHEKLEGDNQYFCGKCGCKQDATRQTSLGTLPPVLNIQLSRYVFDLKTFTKKKLTDKVLLPQRIRVPTRNSDAIGDVLTDKTYLLCAVMKHQGSSAYRGHYVAEVQDFLSGQWYEFNDEKVTLLNDGPSCSYMPSRADRVDEDGDVKMSSPDGKNEKQNGKKKALKLAGSSDAYNMYYVEESYLAKKTLDAFQTLEEQLDELRTVVGKKEESAPDNILQTVARERRNLYERLTELCLADGRTDERLRTRRKRLRIDMLSKCQPSASLTTRDGTESHVWVDAEQLRKFVSCKDRLEDLMRAPPGAPLLRHKNLLCQHAKPGLHPRTARRGKFLPGPMYESYVSLLASERCLFLGEDDRPPADFDTKNELLWDNLNDCLITPQSNLHCEECSSSYLKELGEKVELAKLLKRLYVDLDQKNEASFHNPWELDDGDSDYEESTVHSNMSDQHAYVVAKTFLTACRKKIETDLLKGLNKIATNSSPTTAVSVDAANDVGRDSSTVNCVQLDSLSEGLDALDLSIFRFRNASEAGALDPMINTSISCPHGNCIDAYTKQKVRWLKPDVWESLKKVFPNAIEHKMLCSGTGTGKGAKCPDCEQEQKSKTDLADKLVEWCDQSLSCAGRDLRVLYKQPKADTAIQDIFGANLTSNVEEELPDDFVVVARTDLVLWRKMLDKVFKLRRKTKGIDGHTVRNQLELLLSEKNKDWTKYANAPFEDGFLDALKCTNHSLTVPIFQQAEGSNNSRLSSAVQLLTIADYHNLFASITDICKVLASADSPDSDGDIIDLSSETRLSKPLMPEMLQPPKVRVKRVDLYTKDNNDGLVLLELPQLDDSAGPSPVCLALSPKLCNDEECCRAHRKAQEPENGSLSLYGSSADDPIAVVDSDNEEAKDTFKLKVLEVEAGASNDLAMSALLELQALPSMAAATAVSEDGPRRSTRKRKSRFPCGPILGQDSVGIAMHHNLAAVRMLLYQSCLKFDLDQKLTLIFAPGGYIPVGKSSNGDGTPKEEQPVEPRLKELEFDANDQELRDVYVSLADDPKLERLGDPGTTLVLLRHQKVEEDSNFPQAGLMDALLETANTMLTEHEPKNGAKKKPAERGFQGTLLSSLRVAATEPPKEKPVANEEEAQMTGVLKEADEKAEQSSTVNDKANGEQPAFKKAKTVATPEAETKAQNGTSKGKDSRGSQASPSVLEQLEVKKRRKVEDTQVSSIVVHIKDLLGHVSDEANAIQAAQWAIATGGSSAQDKLKEAAVGRYLSSGMHS